MPHSKASGTSSGDGISIVNKDGSGKKEIVCTNRWIDSLLWSPTGSKIIYNVSSTVWVVDVDTSNVTQVMSEGYFYSGFDWSPDASEIVYAGVANNGSGICKMNADGSQKTFLVEGSMPDWAPSGNKIAYHYYSYTTSGIGIISSTGTEGIQLTTDGGWYPCWSPDAKKIAYSKEDGLWVVDVNSKQTTRVYFTNNYVWSICWSPDSNQLAFSDFNNIYTIGVNGSGVRKINQSGIAFDVDWLSQNMLLYCGIGGNGASPSPGRLAASPRSPIKQQQPKNISSPEAPSSRQRGADVYAMSMGTTTSSYGTIIGTISYAGTKSGTLVYAAFDNPEFNKGPAAEGTKSVNGPFTYSYSLQIGSGTYYMIAFVDTKSDGPPPDIGDPVGIYGTLTAVYLGSVIGTPTPVYVEAGSTISGIDFELTHQIQPITPGTITGTISYSGTKTGNAVIACFTDLSNIDPIITGGEFSISGAGNYTFAIGNIPAGTYYIICWFDAEPPYGDQPMSGDVVGLYGGTLTIVEGEIKITGTPTPVVVEPGFTASGIEFALDTVIPPLPRIPMPIALINVDGTITDWTQAGIQPAGTDTLGDNIAPGTGTPLPGSDLKAVYIAQDSQKLYLRMDVYDQINPMFQGEEHDPARAGSYVFAINTNADIYDRLDVSVVSRSNEGGQWEVRVGGPINDNWQPIPVLEEKAEVAVQGGVIELSLPLDILDRPSEFVIKTEVGYGSHREGAAIEYRQLDEIERFIAYLLPGTITGTIIYSGTESGTLHYMAFDNPGCSESPVAEGTATLTGPFTYNYSLQIEPDTYYLSSFLDVNNNGKPDIGEPAGIYGSLSAYYPWKIVGTPTPVPVTADSIASGINFALTHCVSYPPIAELIIEPSFVNIQINSSITLNAKAKDESGEDIPLLDYTWSLASLGTLTNLTGTQTTFIAGTATGTQHVICQTEGVYATATINIESGKWVVFKVNGVATHTMTEGQPWSMEWNLSSPGNTCIWQWWVDKDSNHIIDTDDKLLIDFEMTDGKPGYDGPGDSDGIANGLILFDVSMFGTISLPPDDFIFCIVDQDSSTATTYLHVGSMTSNRSVSGTVVVPGGDPSDIRIEARYENDEDMLFIALTDENGDYTINLPSDLDKEWEVNAETDIPGYVRPDDKDVGVNGHITGINFTYIQVTATFTGTVKDNLGNPIAGVEIEAENDYEACPVKTNSNGYYEIGVVGGEWKIEPEGRDLYPDYVTPRERRETISNGQRRGGIDFVAHRTTNTIKGRVTGSGGVPNLRIEADSHLGDVRDYTDSDGYYILRVCDGIWDVEVNDWDDVPGFEGKIIQPFRYPNVSAGATSINFQFVSPNGYIQGTVRDEAGNPVPGAGVGYGIWQEWGGWLYGGDCDENGSYTLPVANGSYWVNGNWWDEYCSRKLFQEPVVVNNNTVTGRDFVLNEANSTISGVVTYLGNPVEGVEVNGNTINGYHAWTRTNEHGSYTLRVCNGTWTINVWREGYQSPPAQEEVIGDNEQLSGRDFEFQTPEADLSIRKYGPSKALPGELCQYTFEYINYGDNPAYDVVIIDLLPEEMEYATSSIHPAAVTPKGTRTEVRFEIGTVPGNSSGSFTIAGTISTEVGTFTKLVNIASATSANDPESGNNIYYLDTHIVENLGLVTVYNPSGEIIGTYTLIQDGVDICPVGGRVSVAAATYPEAVYINKRIALVGEEGIYPTISTENFGENRPITIEGTATNGALVSGFKITGATSEGGIGIWNGASPIITNNIITGNINGINPANASPIIINNVITENDVYGIHYESCLGITSNNVIIENPCGLLICGSSSLTIANNIISENGIQGLVCKDNSSPFITNNTIVGNGQTGILCQDNSSPYIYNNIVTGNSPTTIGVRCYGICNESSNIPTIDYNCVWDNGYTGNQNYDNCIPGPNDISKCPQFIGNGNYHLQSYSPCIDVGSNTAIGTITTDKDGNPRIVNGIVDMGAYEFMEEFLQIRQVQPNFGTVGEIVTVSGNTSATQTEVFIDFGISLTITSCISSDRGEFFATFTATTQPSCGRTIITARVVNMQATSEFLLIAYGSITGTIRDKDSNNSIQDAVIKVLQNSTVIGTTTTDTNGSYTISNLIANGTYTVMVQKLGYYGSYTEFTIQAGETKGIDFYLQPANIIYVNDDYTGTESGSQDMPFNTIQEGIDICLEGNIVLVADGTYTGSGNKNLGWSGKKITVRSVNGPNNCIIDCENSGRGFYLNNAGNCGTISGFTITKGKADSGGGIYCYNSSPSITNCTISGNRAGNSGGGICCNNNSSPSITNCTITNNTTDSWDGGGIFCNNNSSSSITNCTILNNNATHGGGGISLRMNSSPSLAHCTISNNIAGWYGGGILCNSSFPTITNCIISTNTVSRNHGGGIYCENYSSPSITNCTISGNRAGNSDAGGGIYCRWYSSPTVVNSILWGDTPQEIYLRDNGTINITYSDIQNGWSGEGNINADPQFVSTSTGNYHLQSTSPCIDKGSNTAIGTITTDLDGNPRIVNGTVDMGAYEFQVTPTPQYGIITGTISYSGTKTGTAYVLYSTDPFFEDDPGIGGTFTINGAGSYPFTISNLLVTTYYIACWFDAEPPCGLNTEPSPGDVLGLHGGTITIVDGEVKIIGTPTPVPVYPDYITTDVNFALDVIVPPFPRIPMPIATIDVDGAITDWEEIQSAGTDTVGDNIGPETSTKLSGSDLQAVYIAKDDENLYLRLDVYGTVNPMFQGNDNDADRAGQYGFGIMTDAGTNSNIWISIVSLSDTGNQWAIWAWDEDNDQNIPELQDNGTVSTQGGIIELALPLKVLGYPSEFIVKPIVWYHLNGGFEGDLDRIQPFIAYLVPDLWIEKSMEEKINYIYPDGTFTYYIRFGNSGGNAGSVTIIDTLPAGINHVTSTAGFPLNIGTSGTQTILTWQVGTLKRGKGGYFELLVHTAPDLLASTTLINTIEIHTPDYEANLTNNYATWTTHIFEIDLQIKKFGKKMVISGDKLTYHIYFNNLSNKEVTKVVIKDTLPQGVIYATNTLLGPPIGTETLIWNVGTLMPNTPDYFDLMVTVGTNTVGTLTNVIEISCAGRDVDLLNNRSTWTTYAIPPIVDLSIKKEGFSKVKAGEETKYIITYENLGDLPVGTVSIIDKLPGSVTYISDNSGFIPDTRTPGIVSWQVGTIDVGEDGAFEVVVKVEDDAVGTLANVVNIVGSATEVNINNNQATWTTRVVAPESDLGIYKWSSRRVPIGGEVNYYIGYMNYGNVGVTYATITDTLPAGFIYATSTIGSPTVREDLGSEGTRLKWQIGPIHPWRYYYFELKAKVETSHGEYHNLAEISFDGIDHNPGNNCATATTIVETPVADLLIGKLGPSEAIPGQTIDYLIQYRNQGNVPIINGTITDYLPEGVTYVSDTSNFTPNTSTPGVVSWQIGTVTGRGGDFKLTVMVGTQTIEGTLTNIVEITGTSTLGIDPLWNNRATATTRINVPMVDLYVHKLAKKEVKVGESIGYKIIYGNHGNTSATNTVITDYLPTGTTYISDTSGFTPQTSTPGQISWDVGTITPDSGGEFILIVQVGTTNITTSTTLTNVVKITSPYDENNPKNNQATAITYVISPEVDLGIMKLAPQEVATNQNITYHIRYRNKGNTEARNVTITDYLPEGVTYVSDNSGITPNTSNQGKVIWQLDTVTSDGWKSFELVASVGNLSPDSVLTNVVEIIGTPSLESYLLDNRATTTTKVVVPITDLAIHKEGPIEVVSGSKIVYHISYANIGNTEAGSVTITDTLPLGVSYLGDNSGISLVTSGNQIIWSLGTLSIGGSRRFSVFTKVGELSTSNTLTNIVKITSNTYDNNSANNTASVTSHVVDPKIDLRIHKSGPKYVAKGQNMTYRISYSNHGNSEATGVDIIDTLPDGVSYISNTLGTPISIGKEIKWHIDNIPKRSHRIFELVVCATNVVASATLVNTITITILPNETNANNNTAIWKTYVVDERADVTIRKYGSGARPGFDKTYYITYENIGTDKAEDVIIVDTLPKEVKYLSSNPQGNYDSTHHTLTWNIPSLNANTIGNINVYVNVKWEEVTVGETRLKNIVEISTISSERSYNNNKFVEYELVRGSIDPNDKLVSPQEYASEERDKREISYKIRFENVATATLPAKYITIVDRLDKDVFDFNTLEFLDIGIGTRTYPASTTTWTYGTTFGTINYNFDITSGTITWYLVGEDSTLPATGTGFLPPNITPPEGEGYVSFKINVKEGVSSGNVIKNSANIRFDFNPWIKTPEVYTVLDLDAPTSTITTPPCSTLTTFLVSWSGEDEVGTISEYTVYVSVDGGSYTVWIEGTSATSAYYTGEFGRSYAFYVVAKDKAGNTSPPSSPASIRVLTTAGIEIFTLGPKAMGKEGSVTLYAKLIGTDTLTMATWTITSGTGTLSTKRGTSTVFTATQIGKVTIEADDGTNTATIILIVGYEIGSDNSWVGSLTTGWGSAIARSGTSTQQFYILPIKEITLENLKHLREHIGIGIIIEAYGTSGDKITTLSNPIQVEIHYKEELLKKKNIDEGTLKLYISSDGTDWEEITKLSRDTEGNIIFGTITHLSYIAPTGKVHNLTEAYVYPNPYYGNKHDAMYFDKVTEGSVIQIFTLAGELVQEIKVVSSPQSWDVRNSSGEKVASGIYLYLIKDPAGNKKVGKLGVIK